jgi:pseudomonalisin
MFVKPVLTRLVIGAVLATLLLSATLSSALAGSSWTATATKAENLRNAISLGAAPASTPLRIAVGLKIRNQGALDNFLRDVQTPGTLTYKHYLTTAQFRNAYAPTATQAQSVASYLSSQGFRNVVIEPNRMYVTASGTVATAQRAFNTNIGQFRQNGASVYANTTAAQVPQSLAGTVVGVLGLSNAAVMHTPNAQPKANDTVPTITGYWARQLWHAYDVGPTSSGRYTPIAIFAEGDLTSVLADLRTYETDHNNLLPQVPVSVVHVGPSSPDTAAADEWDLDTQTSTGMAGNVSHLYVYDTTSLTDGDVALEFNRFVTQNVARAGSASFGECEYQAYLDGMMVMNDQVMSQAAAQGQTVFASAGDTGGFCPVAPTNGAPAGLPMQEYPAASPYVTSVGGTTLLTNADGSYNNEAAWVAGGGGPSLFEYQPYWQQSATPPTSLSCVQVVACLGRNVPDVAMDSDPNTGALIYVGGQQTQIGGTSLGSPLSLGVWARLQSANGNKLGFAAPRFYAVAGTAAFHDVTLGDTGPYPATPGWDYATGLGSFDIARAAKLVPHPPVAPPVPTTLPSGYCVALTDNTGDAHPLASVDESDSLDIRSLGFKSDGANISVALRVKSLSDGTAGQPQLEGDGDYWYVRFTYNKTPYWLGAQYPVSQPDPNNPTSLFQFSYGDVQATPTGGELYNSDGAATGTVDAANGILTITAPLTVFTGTAIPARTVLTGTGAATFEYVGTPAGGLLEQADAAGPGKTHTVGTHC